MLPMEGNSVQLFLLLLTFEVKGVLRAAKRKFFGRLPAYSHLGLTNPSHHRATSKWFVKTLSPTSEENPD